MMFSSVLIQHIVFSDTTCTGTNIILSKIAAYALLRDASDFCTLKHGLCIAGSNGIILFLTDLTFGK